VIAIRGLAGIVTGRTEEPRRDITSLVLSEGVIAGPDAVADEYIDADGRWAVPGAWDGAAGIYFGDHEPRYSARGSLAGAVAFGTTTLVAGAPVPIPGWVGTPRSERERAILTIKSWKHDRPLGIKVVAGVVDADAGWDAPDFADLKANGASTIMVSSAFTSQDVRHLSDATRRAGLRVGFRVSPGAVGQQTFSAMLAETSPNVVVLVGDGSAAAALEVLADTPDASVGLLLTNEIGEAADVLRAAAESDQLHRIFLGTGLPGRGGVLPGGLALYIDVLARCTSIGRDRLMALASGNVARAFGLAGGVLEAGAPADLALVDPAADGAGPGSSWTHPPAMTVIDGAIAWSREGSL
jgi:enamidase